MIRIMILDDDEMYLKKEKEITEHYFAEKNIDCTVTTYQNVEWFLLGLKEEKIRYVSSGYPDAGDGRIRISGCGEK